MIATAHQPAYMPWLGLIHKIAAANVFISWDDVQAEDSGFENRNRVLGTSGPQWITVPVHKRRDVKIKDMTIANDQAWARKHFRAIELGYAKAPFWKQYEPTLRWLYETKWEKLVGLNDQILTFLLREFDLSPQRVHLSTLELDYGRRDGEAPDKSRRIIDACKKVGAWKYVFGEMGAGYADLEAFRSAGIEPFIQKYTPTAYTQTAPGFVPKLWAFDALLNLGPEKAKEVMLAGGTLTRMG